MNAAFIRTVAAAALTNFNAVADWLGIGGGKQQGREYLPLNPKRADTKPGSFTINRDTGAWADFADDARGGDLVALAAYLHGIKQGEAAARLAEFLGIEKPNAPERARNDEREAGNRRRQPPRKNRLAARIRKRTAIPASCPSPTMRPRRRHRTCGTASRRTAGPISPPMAA